MTISRAEQTKLRKAKERAQYKARIEKDKIERLKRIEREKKEAEGISKAFIAVLIRINNASTFRVRRYVLGNVISHTDKHLQALQAIIIDRAINEDW